MPNIPQINIGGTVYKVKDAELREHVVENGSSQPSNVNNRLWVKPSTNETLVPTWDEHNSLKSALTKTQKALDDDYYGSTELTLTLTREDYAIGKNASLVSATGYNIYAYIDLRQYRGKRIYLDITTNEPYAKACFTTNAGISTGFIAFADSFDVIPNDAYTLFITSKDITIDKVYVIEPLSTEIDARLDSVEEATTEITTEIEERNSDIDSDLYNIRWCASELHAADRGISSGGSGLTIDDEYSVYRVRVVDDRGQRIVINVTDNGEYIKAAFYSGGTIGTDFISLAETGDIIPQTAQWIMFTTQNQTAKQIGYLGIKNSILLLEIIPNTTQTITYNADGTIATITYADSHGNTIRQDAFTYSQSQIVETRTAGEDSITITTNLNTLVTEVE